MGRKRLTTRTATVLTAALTVVLVLWPAVASAQVNVTPNYSIKPSTGTAAWIRWMGLGAIAATILIILMILSGYLRFAPKFFGREERPKAAPPGTRPPLLARQARQPVGAARPAGGGGSAATAVAERPPMPTRPAPLPRPAPPEPAAAPPPQVEEPGPTATEATVTPTAAPAAEPAAQADAVGQAEVAAPPPTETAPQPAPAQAPAASHGPTALDQETFDRVLQEQLGKGVDRRVAEGRARAAAVVAARKKAQG